VGQDNLGTMEDGFTYIGIVPLKFPIYSTVLIDPRILVHLVKLPAINFSTSSSIQITSMLVVIN
jgi:hypothetical protein